MARVRIGLTCGAGHFNEIGALWEPVKDKDVDKLAERARVPAHCEFARPGTGLRLSLSPGEECGAPFVGLAHVEDREREANQLARVGGRNIHAGLQQSAPRRKLGPLTSTAWRTAVFEQQRERPGRPALCAVTGEPLNWNWDECHHVLDKRLLHARGLDHVANDARNGMFIKAEVHAGHTSGMKRIPRSKLSDAAWQYARELGSWAVQRLEADYPA